MHTLTDIIVYPIKSLGSVSLTKSYAESRGFQNDRRYMLVDEAGRFLSQRTKPEMTKFRVFLSKSGIQVNCNGKEINIPFNIHSDTFRPISIWHDQLMVPEVSNIYSEWFSNQLKMKCYLVAMSKYTNRPVDTKYAKNNESVSFADGYPYLIIGSGSLDDLNSRLEKPVPLNRFRPNLVIKTNAPFLEDQFDKFQIGDAIFKTVKPCSRCIVTTIDQENGKKGKEPLATLAKYRGKENKVNFGQNLICVKEGKVQVGEKVNLLL